MEVIGISGLLIIMANAYVTYQGLKDHAWLDRYAFQVDRILIDKDYKRIDRKSVV